jgi:methyl-accepting chemotaxis protein
MQLHLYYVKMENVGYNMKTPNLKYILETLLEDQPTPLSKQEKQEFIDQVKRFSELGDSVYGKGDLEQLTTRVRDIINKADQIASESGDWFDGVTVKRHMKNLNDSYKVFESTAKEMNMLQQRLSAAYEDIAQGLSKYFDVQ